MAVIFDAILGRLRKSDVVTVPADLGAADAIHAAQHAAEGADPVTPAAIGAAEAAHAESHHTGEADALTPADVGAEPAQAAASQAEAEAGTEAGIRSFSPLRVAQAIAALVTATIKGALGAADNAIPRVDGTGGVTLQGSDLVIDDATTSTQANVALRNAHSETNSAIVLTPKGAGAMIFGPKPDGVAAVGGNARGANAIDLQLTRYAAGHVASGERAIALGNNHSATGKYVTCIGLENAASMDGAASLGGMYNGASGKFSATIGGYFGNAYLFGQIVHSSGKFAGGETQAQHFFLIARIATAGTDPAVLLLDGSGLHAVLTVESSWYCVVRILARQDDGSTGYAERRVAIERTVNTTRLVGTVQTIGTDVWDTNLGTPTIALTANDTNESLAITVTPANATSTYWMALIDALEVRY